LPRKPSFGRHLRDARIKRGLSVAEVAEQVSVSDQSIYFWENDHVRPRDANLPALCKSLKLPVRATRSVASRSTYQFTVKAVVQARDVSFWLSLLSTETSLP
jgi:transcriptional regulator with XRE-family HTH domain